MLTKLSFLRWGSTFRWFSQRGCQQLTFFRKLIFCSTSFLCEGEWLRIDRFGQPCLPDPPAVTVIIMHQVCLLLLLCHAAEGQGCRINFTVNQLQFAALTFTLAGKLRHQFWVEKHWSSGVWCLCYSNQFCKMSDDWDFKAEILQYFLMVIRLFYVLSAWTLLVSSTISFSHCLG